MRRSVLRLFPRSTTGRTSPCFRGGTGRVLAPGDDPRLADGVRRKGRVGARPHGGAGDRDAVAAGRLRPFAADLRLLLDAVLDESFRRAGRGDGPHSAAVASSWMEQDPGLAFAAVERAYGVDRYIIAAIWGIETKYGAVAGERPVIRSTATLACVGRRQAYFKDEFLAALEILQRGDIRPEQLKGSWAGAFGATQFMPTAFKRYAVDFDGDGRRDVVGSVPDVVASTANHLKKAGWVAGPDLGLRGRGAAGLQLHARRSGAQAHPARMGAARRRARRRRSRFRARATRPICSFRPARAGRAS